MTRFRFYITVLSSRIEVFPLNHWKTSLIDAKDDGKVYYRRKFNGTLQFVDNNGGDDFSTLYVIEVNSPCERIILEIEEKDSGEDTYHEYWTGHFSTTDGEFDLDKCTFTVTPKPYDDYFDIDIYGDDKKNILDAGLSEVTTNTYDTAYTHNYFIVDVIEYLLQEIAPAATLTSWFLNNETSPVLGGTNQYRYLTIAQKSDIRRPLATNPATVGMMSFNEMMDILRMYNLYWTFDGSVLRVEHYDYWEGEEGLDLRTQAISQGANKYSYSKDDMPKYEKFAFMESGDGNYFQHVISYNSPCVNNDVTDEFRVNVTTDLSYIIACSADPDLVGNISDDGWVILASYDDGVDYQVYYGTAYASPYATYNYVNSWAYLLRAFFMHGRVMMSGFIQGIAYDFISERKTKQQPIGAIVCYEDAYNPVDYITTELGETWFGGQKGYVKQATIHPDGKVEFDLLYGADKNIDVELPDRSKNLHVVIDTSSYTEIISILSEPNIYDTYYWIFWNDGAVGEICQEIVIPAGTVYQEDLADLAEPFASIKFNFDDASITGWIKIYNDNSPIVNSDPGDCPAVPPVPPAPPDPTTMIGAAQTVDCDPIHVSWNASALATYYVLYRKPDFSLNDNWVVIDSTVNTYYDDSNQCNAAGYTFTYKVQACNIAGCSADSDETSWDILCM